jgi:hypothetical protein
VTWGFASSDPALSRRPRAVGAAVGKPDTAPRRKRTRARSTDLQFVPVLTSFIAASHASSSRRPCSPVRHSARAFTRGHPRAHLVLRSRSHSARALVRPPSSPSAPPYGGARVRGRLCARPARDAGPITPVSPRIFARLPEPTAHGGTCRRLRSLLASNQWIAETHAVVWPILRGRSPHSLPIESPFVPGAKASPIPSRARKRGVPAIRREPGGDSGSGPDHSDRLDGEATRRRLAGPGTGGKSGEPGPSALGAGQEPTERPPSDALSPGSSRGAVGGRPSASDSAATADSGAGDPPALRQVASQGLWKSTGRT